MCVWCSTECFDEIFHDFQQRRDTADVKAAEDQCCQSRGELQGSSSSQAEKAGAPLGWKWSLEWSGCPISTEFSYLKNMNTDSASPSGNKKEKGVRVGRDQRHRIMSLKLFIWSSQTCPFVLLGITVRTSLKSASSGLNAIVSCTCSVLPAAQHCPWLLFTLTALSPGTGPAALRKVQQWNGGHGRG